MPTEIVLILLAVPGIMSNTFAGVQNVDAEARDAARGMGMRGMQVLRRVEFPCALPLIVSGVRNASLQVIATATVAAQIGLNGLGRYIVDGIARQEYFSSTAPGAVLVAALAIAVDLIWALIARLTISRGLTGHYRRSGRRRPSRVELHLDHAAARRSSRAAGQLTEVSGHPNHAPPGGHDQH